MFEVFALSYVVIAMHAWSPMSLNGGVAKARVVSYVALTPSRSLCSIK